MNILNDKRLLLCASLIKGRVAADIGTDHGLLPAYLIKTGVCDRCIAADINPLPLSQARKTVEEYGLEEKITLVLSDGLKEVCLDGVSDIVIAGMGGELISKIIDECDALKANDNVVSLILQPMTRPWALREYLYNNHFEIAEEKCVREGRFIYSVIRAEYTGITPEYDLDDRYRYFGRIDLSSDMGLEYAQRRTAKILAAAEGMLKSEEHRAQGEREMRTAEYLRGILMRYRKADG